MRMLVIDDEEDICEIIAEVGGRRGLDVRTLSNTDNVASTLTEFQSRFHHARSDDAGHGRRRASAASGRTRQKRQTVPHQRQRRARAEQRAPPRQRAWARCRRGAGKTAGYDRARRLFRQDGGRRQDGESATIWRKPSLRASSRLHYQPVIEMATRRVKGAEALARWAHPHRGMLLPDAFLEQVVNDGLMQALTDMVVQDLRAAGGAVASKRAKT